MKKKETENMLTRRYTLTCSQNKINKHEHMTITCNPVGEKSNKK